MPAGERTIALASFALSALLVIFIFVTGGVGQMTALIIIIAAALPTIGLVIFKYGYWIVPFLTRRVRVIDVIEEPYTITSSQDAVIKKVGSTYYASMFIHVKIYESTTEKSNEEKYAFMDLWERAVSSLKFVTKFCFTSYVKDLSKYKEIIETKKADAQLRLANEKGKPEPNEFTTETIEREISMWDNIISKLMVGDNPISQITYIMTTGEGATEDMALAAVKNQANEIKSTIATTLNAEVAVLTGDDMKRCFEWEHLIPPVIREERV